MSEDNYGSTPTSSPTYISCGIISDFPIENTGLWYYDERTIFHVPYYHKDTWCCAYEGEKKPVTNEELKAKMEVIKQTLYMLLSKGYTWQKIKK